jgi:hypothetical protein
MARAFPKVLYVQSAPGILKAFAHWAELHPEMKLRVPAKITFDEQYVAEHVRLGAKGPNPTGSWTIALIDIIHKYIASCDSGKCPYEGIVFDEWNTICERIFAELKNDPWGKFKGRNGNLNIFAVFDYFKGIHRAALSLARRTNRMVGFVSHYQLPKVDEEENSPTKGLI